MLYVTSAVFSFYYKGMDELMLCVTSHLFSGDHFSEGGWHGGRAEDCHVCKQWGRGRRQGLHLPPGSRCRCDKHRVGISL